MYSQVTPRQRNKMYSQRNITTAKVNSLGATLKKIRPKTDKNHYSWADSLFRAGKISGPLLHTLKAIIACLGLDKPTIAQINAARTRSAARKFAQSNAVSDRTVRRHIQDLETLRLIAVTRSRDARRNSRNAYAAMVPEPVLSCRSEDTMSPSITLATSSNYNNTKIDTPKEKLAKKLDMVFDEKQLAILTTLLSWGTWKGLAIRWLEEFTTDEMLQGINYVKGKNLSNPGGYMRAIMRGLDERKRAIEHESGKQGTVTMDNEPADVRAARARRIEKEAVARLGHRGITDPRTGGRIDYDECRNYDILLTAEVRKIYSELAHTYAKN